jgi:hypothetical protein
MSCSVDRGGSGSAAMRSRRKEIHLIALWSYLEVRALAVRRMLDRLATERGQGTVEYVGLILLVSLLMVGMVAAMKGFNGKQGVELADVIVEKIKQAVNAVTFR